MVKKSIIPCVSIFLIMIIMLIACSKRCVGSSEYKYSYEGYSEYTYTVNEMTFNFKYPEKWIVLEDPTWESSEEVEARPLWGVKVFKG